MAIMQPKTYVKSRIVLDQKQNLAYYCRSNIQMQKYLSFKYPLISLFTGGGGLDLGLEWAGFKTVAFVEKDEACIKTIKENRKEWPLVGSGDITNLSATDILKTAKLQKGEAVLVAGGAPCQPFSRLGKNHGETTTDGSLYKHFIRLVKDIQPYYFLFENVRGMAQNHKKIIDFMKTEFSEIGYSMSIGLLCAADYGVPQKRYRVFIIGKRDGTIPGFPLPTHSEKPKQTLSYYKALCNAQGFNYPYEKMKKWTTVRQTFDKLTYQHYARNDSFQAVLAPKIIDMIAHIEPGTKMHWRDLPDDLKFNCWKSNKFKGYDNFGRLQFDEPAVTIRTGAVYPAKGRYIHPLLNRGLNTIEMAALQTFPLNIQGKKAWTFCGGITQVARQIGNAVPPLLAKAIGESLIDQM